MSSIPMFRKLLKKTLENTLELTIKSLMSAYSALKNSTAEEEPKDSLLSMITRSQ